MTKIILVVESKFCRDCNRQQPISQFTRHRNSRDGYAFYCHEHARLRHRVSRDRRTGGPKRRYPRGLTVPDGHKWCPDCTMVKPLTEFGRNAASTSGVASYCKPCHNARGRVSEDLVGGERTYHLRRRYGITAEDADAMLEEQGGFCAVCRTEPALHVDHDHATGAVRALLCLGCNGGLGQVKDDPEVLRAAAHYVGRHRASPRSVSRRPGGGEARDPHGPGVSRDRRCCPGFARWPAMQASS